MKKKINLVSERTARRILADPGMRMEPGVRGIAVQPMLQLAKLDSATTGATAGQLTSTTATLYAFSPASSPATLTNTNQSGTYMSVTVWNPWDCVLPADTYVILTKLIDGWLITQPLWPQMLVRFTLDSAMTTSDSSKAATITNQYGLGVQSADTSITVHNMQTASGGVYLFEGSSGAAGLAFWDTDDDYIIVQMECP